MPPGRTRSRLALIGCGDLRGTCAVKDCLDTEKKNVKLVAMADAFEVKFLLRNILCKNLKDLAETFMDWTPIRRPSTAGWTW